ncbi:hypothetical protein Plhal703r1_c12g0060771 [Plasmopara halstedii]
MCCVAPEPTSHTRLDVVSLEFPPTGMKNHRSRLFSAWCLCAVPAVAHLRSHELSWGTYTIMTRTSSHRCRLAFHTLSIVRFHERLPMCARIH